MTRANRYTDTFREPALPATVEACLRSCPVDAANALRRIFEVLNRRAPKLLEEVAPPSARLCVSLEGAPATSRRARALGTSGDLDLHASDLDFLTQELIGAVTEDKQLVRVSLTVPRQQEPCLLHLKHAYARKIAEADPSYGALLAVDQRPKTLAPHVYGIVLCDPALRALLAENWCALTGADPEAHRGTNAVQCVAGAERYAKHRDATILHANLRRVLEYAFKPLPNGRPRSISHVAASGALLATWGSLVGDATLRGVLAPERLEAIGVGVTSSRLCASCGRDISRRRADAQTCSGKCRVRIHRRRGGHRNAGADKHGP